jgi:hypothetical protein
VQASECYYVHTCGFTIFSSGNPSPGCTPSSGSSAGSRTKKNFLIVDSEVKAAQASSGLLSGPCDDTNLKPECSLVLSFGTLTAEAEQVTWATELDVWAEEIQESDLRLAMTVLQRRVVELSQLLTMRSNSRP